MNLNDIAKNFSDEDKARAFLEAQRWPKGTTCPHCGVEGESYRLKPKENGKTHVRAGVWKCGGCRKQFTVRVGTIFEDSHIPLHKWLMDEKDWPQDIRDGILDTVYDLEQGIIPNLPVDNQRKTSENSHMENPYGERNSP